MNKKELVLSVAEKMAVKMESEKVDKLLGEYAVEAFVETIEEQLAKGEKVNIYQFGSFEIAERGERMGRNPKDGTQILIPACKSPKFKASKNLKDLVNV